VVDATTVDALRVGLERAADRHGRIVVDLREVTSISTEGIRVLYQYAEDLRAVVVAAHSLLHKALVLASRFPVLIAPPPAPHAAPAPATGPASGRTISFLGVPPGRPSRGNETRAVAVRPAQAASRLSAA
jgi:hypothetical protein